MLRDTRKTAAYFERYISCQSARIEKFEGVLRQIQEKGGDASKEKQCHLFLSGFYRDMLSAQYSSGEDMAVLRETCSRYFSHIRAQESLSYSAAENALSWAILLDMQDRPVSDAAVYPEDAFLNALYRYLTADSGPAKGPLLFPAVSEKFLQCLEGTSAPEELRNYIESGWYENSSDEAWYESDKRENDTYCGYWCLPGAAVVKILCWDAAKFKDINYFPINLLI